MPKTFYAVKVDPGENNNKFYSMRGDDAGQTFEARWGRVGSSGQTKVYPAYDWDRIVRDKLKKGYVEQTAVKSIGGFSFQSLGGSVGALIASLQRAAGAAVSGNYASAETITQAQIDQGQKILDNLGDLNGRATAYQINDGLIKLWTVLPRKMRSVSDELLMPSATRQIITAKLSAEQDIIDQLAGQVATPTQATGNDQTILAAMGIQAWEATTKEIDTVMSLVERGTTRKIGSVFAVRNTATQTAFEAWKAGKVDLRFHGSRTENWWNIIGQGLKIRPAATNGSMFGRGLYFADKADKSIGYTSLSGSRWANGYDNRAFMAVYAVKMGKTEVLSSSYVTAHQAAKRGEFDSVWARAGAFLRNDEFVIYHEQQATIAYLVELKL